MYPNVIQYETRLRDLERELQRLTHDFDEIALYERTGIGRRLWAFLRRGSPKASPAAQRA